MYVFRYNENIFIDIILQKWTRKNKVITFHLQYVEINLSFSFSSRSTLSHYVINWTLTPYTRSYP